MGQPLLADEASDDAGWVYVMTQPHHSRCKVGMTKLDPETRARVLYSTGVPERFVLEYAVFSADNRRLEHALLQRLDGNRPNPGREFLDISLTKIVAALEDCSEQAHPILFRVVRSQALKRLQPVLRKRGLAPTDPISFVFRRYARGEGVRALANQHRRRVERAAEQIRRATLTGLGLAALSAPAAAAVSYSLMGATPHAGAVGMAMTAGAGVAGVVLLWRSHAVRRIRDGFKQATRTAVVQFWGQLIEPGVQRAEPLTAVLQIRPSGKRV